ncbi:MAG: gliding motility-associated C-terminal domain-containing protein [Saprospiraceae bacterium]|nr:gliding motility-associated C-terminal domain-containing protein [Saprospiraceae bacterium]
MPGKVVGMNIIPTNGPSGAASNVMATVIPTSNEVIFQGLREGLQEFEVVVTDEYGITDTTKYIITVTSRADTESKRIELYNAISPNGDGVNDVLVIKNIERYGENTIRIFDRWGSEVLRQSDYKNDWNATWNGNDLPDGTYFYIFTAANDVRESGYIEVKR